jgi:hypothetical protein
MNIEILTAIISSAALSTIISSLFAFFQSNTKNRLERITDERKKWRDDLRDFVGKFLEAGDDDTRRRILANLKVRINA